ncbi:MAG: phytanoyl-CoA dioxygenase family protein [Candidatus Limnocylindria bacterium]
MAIEARQKELWLYEFDLNGFIILYDFLPRPLVEAMREAILPIVRGEIARAEKGDTQHLRGRNRLSFDLRPYLQSLEGPLGDARFRQNPVIEELVGALMSPWRHGVTKAECPFHDSSTMTWHPDTTLEENGDSAAPVRPRRITFNVPLVDINDANGPMEVIPGSHRMRHDLTPVCIGALPRLHPVRLLLRRGDCVLRDGNLLHRGTTNTTSEPRILLDQTYRLREESAGEGPPSG